MEYIAQEQSKLLTNTLAKAKFFSIPSYGSTNAASIENELFVALYLDPHAPDGKVHVRNRFLSVRQPTHADAQGSVWELH